MTTTTSDHPDDTGATATDTLSRRDLLGKTAAAGLGLSAASVFNILPVHAQPSSQPAPVLKNSKIVLGLIGCGGMGSANMRTLMGKPEIEVAALCDVDESRMGGDIAEVEKKYGKKPETYKDYRKMLERKDINAVIVGTPDHWHALNQIHASEAGKDSYCEKPISHNIVEAKSMVGAAKRYNSIVQVGTWQRSTREFVSAVEYIRSGKLGKITTVRAWKTDGSRMGQNKPGTAVPATFDYDRWIGPAAFVPYIPNYTHGNWRWFFNYGSGMTGDWGVHMMDIGLLGMSKTWDLVMPTEVSAYGGKLAWPDDDRTAPDTHVAIMKFSNPDFVLHWETGRKPLDGGPDHGTEFIAADGKSVMVWRGGWKVVDADGKELPKEEAPGTNDHWQNWIDCVKTRTQPRSNLLSMAQSTIVCHLANAALLAGETVRWDKNKMDIVGKAGKNTLSYQRPYRKPYKLPIYPI
uniref:Glycosyl hydrolase family 109 protein n=1 Tax=uncultured Armatimonadetes bacterium TaxID=157466 RepID=A0A6J4IKN6_9BACT|nr:GH109 [uncultured Armatimonadetes bacterium]